MTADRATTAPQAPPRSRERRLAPVFALLFLAPWAAECSWGGFTLADTPFVVVILAPLYGAAAVLIREVARRTGGGWPAIALLAAAFGVYQAGLVDQALFNDAYLDDTQFADWSAAARATEVPLLGFNAEQAVAFIGNHIVLTICAPIAIVESFLGRERRHRPWLGVPGLIAVGVLLLLGSLMVFTDDGGRKGLMATPPQLSFAAVTVLALIAVAMLPRWRRRDRRVAGPATRKAPRAVWVGLVALGAHVAGSLMSGWGGVVLRLAAAVVAAAVIVTWSRRTAWEQPHVLAAWSAGLVSAAAFAYLTPTYEPSGPVAALVGDIAVSVVALTLVTSAFWKLRHEARRSQQP